MWEYRLFYNPLTFFFFPPVYDLYLKQTNSNLRQRGHPARPCISVKSEHKNAWSSLSVDLLTLLSHSIIRGQCFVIIMPHFTICQGNSITSMWTEPGFCVPRVNVRLSFYPPLSSCSLPQPFLFFSPPSRSASGAIIVSQLTAFLQEGTARMTTTFGRLEGGCRGGRSLSTCRHDDDTPSPAVCT